MDRGRRQALSFVGSAPLLLASGIGNAAADRTPRDRPAYFSAYGAADGACGVAAFGADGGEILDAPLPARAHGISAHPGGDKAVAFARRPGTFAVVIRRRDGAGRARLLRSPPGRHFCGHGVHSRDGEFLFTTENDFHAGRGVVGVWRTRPTYRRAREFPSHGVGPHELVLSGDGSMLIVANGGILTHPDTGRRKLNVPTMSPSLAYIDPSDGRLARSLAFDEPRRRLLGIRHLAVAGGLVCLALQDEGPSGDPLPLVAFHGPDDAGLDLRPAPRAILRRMKGYTGSVAADSSGAYFAVTAPRGGVVTIWDAGRRELSASFDVADGSGVAAEGRPGRFLATSGAGGAALLDAATGRTAAVESRFLARLRWDNHLTRANDKRGSAESAFRNVSRVES